MCKLKVNIVSFVRSSQMGGNTFIFCDQTNNINIYSLSHLINYIKKSNFLKNTTLRRGVYIIIS